MSRCWRVGLVLGGGVLALVGCGSGPQRGAVRTQPSASAREPTKGPLPAFHFVSGEMTPVSPIPDYVEVHPNGYAKKCESGYVSFNRDCGFRPPPQVVTVYGPDLRTVVGHLYNLKGFVPLGTNPAEVPDLPTTTLTTTSTRPPVITGRFVVPDIRGMSTERATAALVSAGLYAAAYLPNPGSPVVSPTSIVTAQSPPPGTVLTERSAVYLTLVRAPH